MKHLRRYIRKLVLESTPGDHVSKIKSMATAGHHDNFLHAKELALSLGLDINLELEVLKKIEKSIQPIMNRTTGSDGNFNMELYEETPRIEFFFSWGDLSSDESYATVWVDDEGIKLQDDGIMLYSGVQIYLDIDEFVATFIGDLVFNNILV
tara:strand:- start:41698 stop:42153 length:456 start_codon:yes stop_codon:yes gene_type:complete